MFKTQDTIEHITKIEIDNSLNNEVLHIVRHKSKYYSLIGESHGLYLHGQYFHVWCLAHELMGIREAGTFNKRFGGIKNGRPV